MGELSEQGAAIVEQATADAATQLTKANKRALDFMMGAQKVLLGEMVFAGNELLERSRTEMHLFSEFISKMAGSHSVKDLETMGEGCARRLRPPVAFRSPLTASAQPASDRPQLLSVSGASHASG